MKREKYGDAIHFDFISQLQIRNRAKFLMYRTDRNSDNELSLK